jgi:hypothetical protein
MTLKELQKMIKEEFGQYVNEQAGGPMGGPGAPGGPGGPGGPMPGPDGPQINVEPGDIDMPPPAGGPEGAEGILQNIFQQLQSYFDAAGMGGAAAMGPDADPVGDMPDIDTTDAVDADGEEDMDIPDDMGADVGAEEPVDLDGEEDDDEEETIDEAYGETKGGNATSNGGKYGGAYGATGTDEGNPLLHEGFKTRLQKLANIKK